MPRLVGERRALSALVLAFYTLLFTLVALSPPGPGWTACFGALAGAYGAAFFGLVAGYFWARWYAIGVGLSGFITGVISVFQMGWEPILVFYGATHGAASLLLWGDSVASSFDGRAEWRQRFHMDENATHRLGKSVIRLGVSLPYVIMYALAPRPDGSAAVLGIVGLGLALAGGWALTRMRTWGVLALGGAAAALVAAHPDTFVTALSHGYAIDLGGVAAVAAIFLAAAVAPFVRPFAKHLAGR